MFKRLNPQLIEEIHNLNQKQIENLIQVQGLSLGDFKVKNFPMYEKEDEDGILYAIEEYVFIPLDVPDEDLAILDNLTYEEFIPIGLPMIDFKTKLNIISSTPETSQNA